MCAGVEERFGKGILQRLEKQRTIPMKGDKPWTLTYEVCPDLACRITQSLHACAQLSNFVHTASLRRSWLALSSGACPAGSQRADDHRHGRGML